MTTKGKLTRDQAVEIVGEAAVAKVEATNCDFTNRLMPNCDDIVEFAAAVRCEDNDGMECTLIAYYYPTQEELDDAGDDLGNVPWEIEGYEVI
jgi:hypothetical protein